MNRRPLLIADCGFRMNGIPGNSQSAIRNSKSKGFTLLEVMLAMLILTFFVATIYSSFSTMSQSVKNAETDRDVTDLARTLIAKMTDDITNAYYVAGMQETFFYGKSSTTSADEPRFDSLALTTLTNWRRPGSKETDLWEVGYRFQDKADGSGKLLIRSEKRELSKDVPPLEGETDYVLTDRVAALQLRYYNGSTWMDDWDNRNSRAAALPKEVELGVVLDDGTSFLTHIEVGR